MSIAVVSAIVVLAISAISAAASDPSPLPGPANGGGGMAMCVQGVPDCDDMIVGDGGQSEPGFGGGSEPVVLPPDDGSLVHDIPCGVEVVEGEGPDATVSYTPCENDEPPVPTEPTITEPTPGMANVHPRPFDSAVVAGDGITVTIDFVSGVEPCYVLDHIDVVETDDTVTITLYEGSDASTGQAVCIEIGVFKRAIITLDAPLAGRTIVDGAA
jgi:hypothetical protein